jgi:hypothetical protein
MCSQGLKKPMKFHGLSGRNGDSHNTTIKMDIVTRTWLTGLDILTGLLSCSESSRLYSVLRTFRTLITLWNKSKAF